MPCRGPEEDLARTSAAVRQRTPRDAPPCRRRGRRAPRAGVQRQPRPGGRPAPRGRYAHRGPRVDPGDPPAADERRALGELAALVSAAAGRRPEVTVVLAGGMAEHLAAFGDGSARPGRGPARARGAPWHAGWTARRTPDRTGRTARRRPALAGSRRAGPGRGPRPAGRRGRDRVQRRKPRRGGAGRRWRIAHARPRRGPERGARTRGPRRFGDRSRRAMVHVGRRPASPARSPP